MWKITNTVMDRSKALLHRRASKMQEVPTINGRRLLPRQVMMLDDDAYRRNYEHICHLARQGVVEVADTRGKAPVAEPQPVKKAEPRADAPPVKESWETTPTKAYSADPTVKMDEAQLHDLASQTTETPPEGGQPRRRKKST
jgi:hypothetical protein